MQVFGIDQLDKQQAETVRIPQTSNIRPINFTDSEGLRGDLNQT